MSKVKIEATVKINACSVIDRAVSDGITSGWRRAHKHTDEPGEAAIKEQLEMSISNALAEVLIFGDIDDGVVSKGR